MNSKKYGVIIIKESRTRDKMHLRKLKILILMKSDFKRHDALTCKIGFKFLKKKFGKDLAIGNGNDFEVNERQDMDEQ
ncbi:hypothetical protein M9H77_02881 [Catharanthus roseus]|uniref:Uncharacterized protein n=1 Tax=Catharanthus roseus TaxID=4058 RepID=A0ACC0C9K6_CATRO|nr:hypothetical protein M9H77_02881 [Catharanthus roseus]